MLHVVNLRRNYGGRNGIGGYAVVQLVEALRCMSDGRGFNSR